MDATDFQFNLFIASCGVDHEIKEAEKVNKNSKRFRGTNGR
jgi:hypothetical protein